MKKSNNKVEKELSDCGGMIVSLSHAEKLIQKYKD